jgi:hypothetical protein
MLFHSKNENHFRQRVQGTRRSNEIEHSYGSRALNWSKGLQTKVETISNCDLTYIGIILEAKSIGPNQKT